MTHARQKGSPGPSDGGPLWPHGGAAVAMADAWTERSLRFGRTKKIAVEVVKQRGVPAERADGENGRTEKKSHRDRKPDPGRDKKRDRKSYPLRGRAAGSGGEGLSCRVLLTRLDESVRERKCSGERAARREASLGAQTPKSKSVKRKEAEPRARSKSKSSSPSRGESAHVPRPRKRRLASLNAEAVNSLLLERANESHSAAKQARRRSQTAARGASPDAKTAGSGGGLKASRGTGERRRSSEKVKKVNRAEMSQESLDAPAPRRLAGLNAAALLRLTSSSATSKQRAKNVPAADRKAARRHSGVKHKARSQQPRGGEAAPLHGGGGGCTACEEKKKKKADFEPKVEWDTGGCTRRLTKPGYQSRGVLAFPLKQVKEEQLEAELSPYYCCPPEGSVEYCHRLAFFLGRQPYGGPDRPALAAAMTPVKGECLAASPPPPHSHPHAHAALTLSPHPCLCTADHCFSSYYVHIAHPTTHAGTTATSAAAASMASRPLNFAPAGLCPNRTTGSKLLGPPPRHAYCNSVASACYGDACGIGGYAYRAVPPPAASRGCSFSAACAGCTRAVKTGERTTKRRMRRFSDWRKAFRVPPTHTHTLTIMSLL